MESHFFYIVATDDDCKRRVAKGGETEDPYMRLKRYGTSRYSDDPFRYRFLVKISGTDISLIHKIEKLWLAKFEEIESGSEDELDLNRAATVEGVRYEKDTDFLAFFLETLSGLNLKGLFIKAYQTNEEINEILKEYRQKQIRSRQLKTFAGISLRPYQIEDVQATLYAFQVEKIRRGYWSIQCGLGKTLMSFALLLEMGLPHTLFVVPRNTLLHQVLRSFLSWSYPHKQLFYCSSSKMPNDLSSLTRIRTFAQLPGDTPWVCVITYDSLPLLKEAKVDLTIFDEGHHLVPSAKKQDLSGNLFGLSEDNIRSKYRLIVTATPKNTPLNENDETTYIGMSHQPERYGTCLAERNYIFGRDAGFLCPFEVICIKTEGSILRSLIQTLKKSLHLHECTMDRFLKELELWEKGRSRTMLEYIDHSIDVEEGEDVIPGDLILWYALVAYQVIQAIQRYNCRRIVTYHTTKKRAELFQRVMTLLWDLQNLTLSLTCETVHSGNAEEVNEEVKRKFKAPEGADIRILCNIRTLIEGFDEPSIDTTVFVDNKWSPIEATQIVGRGNRKDPRNPLKFHRVLIPFLSYEIPESEDMYLVRTTNDYKTVRYTIKNIILSHDPNQSISQTVWVPKPKQSNKPHEDAEEEEATAEVDPSEKVWIDEGEFISHDLAILGACETSDLAGKSFQQARLWMHELARRLGWQKFVGESQISTAWNQYRETHILPKEIPHDPSKVYRQVGWIHWRDYVGLLTKREEWQELHAGELLELFRSGRINLFDHTLSSLRTQVESILTRKLPAHPKSKWKLSLYDLVERAVPGSTKGLTSWGSYPDKLYSLLEKEEITDAIDFERRWPELHAKHPTLPGIPTELWTEAFWANYDPA